MTRPGCNAKSDQCARLITGQPAYTSNYGSRNADRVIPWVSVVAVQRRLAGFELFDSFQ